MNKRIDFVKLAKATALVLVFQLSVSGMTVFGGESTVTQPSDQPTESAAESSTHAPWDITNHWAKTTILEWQSKDFIGGYDDGSFRPNQTVTRAEFIRFLNLALDTKEKAEIQFSDVLPDQWYYDEIAKAQYAGYAAGFEDGTFRPEELVTRAQAAQFLSNALKLEPNQENASLMEDAQLFPDWATGAVGAALEKGYLSGYPDGSFQPLQGMTRAEAVSTLDRVIGKSSADGSTLEEAPSDEEGPEDPIESSDERGNLMIHKPGTISNRIVRGDLILLDTIGEGQVFLENVTVRGNTYVRGGGSHSVYFKNCELRNTIQVEKLDVRLVFQDKTTSQTIKLEQPARIETQDFTGKLNSIEVGQGIPQDAVVTIDAPVDEVVVSGASKVVIETNLKTLTVKNTAKDAKIDITKGTTVKTLVANEAVKVVGYGAIDVLKANASGINTEIKPGVTKTAPGVKKPTASSPGTGAPAAGSGGGGGGGSAGGGGGSAGDSGGSGGSSGGGGTSTPTVSVEKVCVVDEKTIEVYMIESTGQTSFALSASQSGAGSFGDIKTFSYANGRYTLSLGEKTMVAGTNYTLTVRQTGKKDKLCTFFFGALLEVASVNMTAENTATVTLASPADSTLTVGTSNFIARYTEGDPAIEQPMDIKTVTPQVALPDQTDPPSQPDQTAESPGQTGTTYILTFDSLQNKEGKLIINGKSTDFDYKSPEITSVSLVKAENNEFTLQFNSSEAGTFYYALINPGASAPEIGSETGWASVTMKKDSNSLTLTNEDATSGQTLYYYAEDVKNHKTDIQPIIVPEDDAAPAESSPLLQHEESQEQPAVDKIESEKALVSKDSPEDSGETAEEAERTEAEESMESNDLSESSESSETSETNENLSSEDETNESEQAADTSEGAATE